jgi:hypothetical protein
MEYVTAGALVCSIKSMDSSLEGQEDLIRLKPIKS